MCQFSRRLGTVAVAVVVLLLATGNASAQLSGAEIYKLGVQSTCYVYVPKHGSGSGSLIDVKNRYVITNEHVVGNADFAIVHFPMKGKDGKIIGEKQKYIENISSNRGIRGKVLAREEKRDLAVIQLERLPEGVAPVTLGTGNPDAAEDVHSIGNPAASDNLWIYTAGKVRSVYKKTWTAGGIGDLTNHSAIIIETDSKTNAGDSGGPLFNKKGEQIGVTQGGLSSRVADGFSYFIDVREVKEFLRERKIVLAEAPKSSGGTDTKVDPVNPDPKKDPVVTNPPKKEPKKDPAAIEAEKMEKAAAAEFSLLKSLATNPNTRERSIEKLQAFIKKYPKTAAATEARDLLKKIDK